jgi:hypothetical protein
MTGPVDSSCRPMVTPSLAGWSRPVKVSAKRLECDRERPVPMVDNAIFWRPWFDFTPRAPVVFWRYENGVSYTTKAVERNLPMDRKLSAVKFLCVQITKWISQQKGSAELCFHIERKFETKKTASDDESFGFGIGFPEESRVSRSFSHK